MTKKIKSIQIDIEFNQLKDLIDVFDHIRRQLKIGKEFDRIEIKDSIVNYSMQYEKLEDFKEEIINGKWCQIYKSKI